MFVRTEELIRQGADRNTAKQKLRQEIKAAEDAALDGKLTDLETQVADKQAREKAEQEAAKVEEKRRTDIAKASKKALAAAAKLDKLFTQSEAAFAELDVSLDKLWSLHGPRIATVRRRGLLIAAAWKSAPKMHACLGLARSAGGASKWQKISASLRELTDAS